MALTHVLPKLFPMIRLLLLTLCASTAMAAAEIPSVIRLWPGAAPGSERLTMTEKITERSKNPARPDRIYTRIIEPSLTVHVPAHPNGVAVIVAPGGGYARIVIDKEGPDTSAWLNGLGVTAFVLKYRLPGEGHERGYDAPLEDAQRAVRVVRAHASEWGLDPNRIGFVGYSAGGHLGVSLTFYFDRNVYAPVDAADSLSARPDFSILGYAIAGGHGVRPASLDGLRPEVRILWEYPAAARPGMQYPPTFIFQADDDPTVSPDNAARIYLALKQAHTSAELHIFKRGGHGFGIRGTSGPNSHWPELCAEWMREVRMLP